MTDPKTDPKTDDSAHLAIVFRCPPELEPILPRPIPAMLGLPDWFKAMPHSSFSEVRGADQLTVKKCPPFIDAMTYGFLMPLVADVRIADGMFTWDLELPNNPIASYTRSPLDFHDNSQVIGSPMFEEDQFVIKFNMFWTIEAPPGYSLLITHPLNRYELPFHTLTGLVDADRYKDNFMNFPALWRDPGFNGTLPRGTPVAQCVPIKRDLWDAHCETITGDAITRLQETSAAVIGERGVYRRQFRAPKR